MISKADEAHRLYHNLDNEIIDLQFEAKDDIINISTDSEPFQSTPFTAIELHNGEIFRVYTEKTGKKDFDFLLQGCGIVLAGLNEKDQTQRSFQLGHP